jgi:hypothetical protein
MIVPAAGYLPRSAKPLLAAVARTLALHLLILHVPAGNGFNY